MRKGFTGSSRFNCGVSYCASLGSVATLFEQLLNLSIHYPMSSDTACDVRCLHPNAVKRAVAALETEPSLVHMAALFAALGDPTRLRLLMALKTGPLCTCDLAVVLGVTESAVSHQLRTLKALDLVRSERQDRMMFHHLADGVVGSLTEVAGRRVEEATGSVRAA